MPWLFAMYLFLSVSMSVCLPAFLSIYPSTQKINHYFKITEDNKRLTPINSLSFFSFHFKMFSYCENCLPTLAKEMLIRRFKSNSPISGFQSLPFHHLSNVVSLIIPSLLCTSDFPPTTSSFLTLSLFRTSNPKFLQPSLFSLSPHTS